MTRVFDFAGNQAAWWWCILCVGAGHAWLALVGPAAYVLAHLALRAPARSSIATLAVAAAAVGFVADSALVRSGYLRFPGASTSWTAPFMIALWAAFGVSLTASMKFLRARPVAVAAAIGAVAGPIAYAGGERLGVLGLAPRAWLAVGVAWAAALAALALVARKTEARETEGGAA